MCIGIWKALSGRRAEIENMKITYSAIISISAVPPEDTFRMLTHV